VTTERGAYTPNGGAQLCFADSLDCIWLQVCDIDHQLHLAILTTTQGVDYKILPASPLGIQRDVKSLSWIMAKSRSWVINGESMHS